MLKYWITFLCLASLTFQLMVTQPISQLEINNNNIALKSKLDLVERHNLLLEFEKHFAQLSRVAIKAILESLQAQTERSVANESKITKLSAALSKIESINLIDEPLDKHEVRIVTNAVADLIELKILKMVDLIENPILHFEIQTFNEIFEEVFDDFIGTLTPEEQLLDAELIKVHKLYEASGAEEKYGVLPKVWKYFEL